MLFARKHLDGPFDEFYGSPYVADVQRRLMRSLAVEDPEGWYAWADASQHAIAVGRFEDFVSGPSCSDWWNSATDPDRRRFVLDCLAPLRVPDHMLATLVAIGPFV